MQSFDIVNNFFVGGGKDGIAVSQFGVDGKKLLENCFIVDRRTAKIFQRIVQFREECNFGGDTIREERWVSLVVKICAAKTVAITVWISTQGTLGVCLGVLDLTVGPRLIGRVKVFPIVGGAG